MPPAGLNAACCAIPTHKAVQEEMERGSRFGFRTLVSYFPRPMTGRARVLVPNPPPARLTRLATDWLSVRPAPRNDTPELRKGADPPTETSFEAPKNFLRMLGIPFSGKSLLPRSFFRVSLYRWNTSGLTPCRIRYAETGATGWTCTNVGYFRRFTKPLPSLLGHGGQVKSFLGRLELPKNPP